MTNIRPEDTGLEDRYVVERRSDPTGRHATCRYFVLDPRHDPHAVTALRAYSAAVRSERPALADDLDAWVGAPASDTRREDDALVETAARALYEVSPWVHDGVEIPWGDLTALGKDAFRDRARAVLAALPAHPVAGEATLEREARVEIIERLGREVECADGPRRVAAFVNGALYAAARPDLVVPAPPVVDAIPEDAPPYLVGIPEDMANEPLSGDEWVALGFDAGALWGAWDARRRMPVVDEAGRANPFRCRCGHGADAHEQGSGCLAGWTWDEQGCATGQDGCPCQWVHISSPTAAARLRGATR